MVYKSINSLTLGYLRSKSLNRNDATSYSLRDFANKLAIPLSTNYLRYSNAVLGNSLPQNVRQVELISRNIVTSTTLREVRHAEAFIETRF